MFVEGEGVGDLLLRFSTSFDDSNHRLGRVRITVERSGA